MNSNSEELILISLDALHQWWGNLGAFAWIPLGVLLVFGITFLSVLMRLILRGGIFR